MKKKACHRDSEPTGPEVTSPEQRTQRSGTPSSEAPRQDDSGPAAKPTDGSCSAPPAPVVATSPLGQAEHEAPPPQKNQQVASKLRLAQLEMEAQQLRQLLGLEATTSSRCPTPPNDLVAEQPDGMRAEAAAVVGTSREVGCQTDVAEVGSHVDSKWI